jgi:pyridoxine kinase
MGDIGLGYYVRSGIPEFYRDRALALADVVTPNRFELEWLSGGQVRSLPQAAAATIALRQRGPDIVLATSLEIDTNRVAVVAAGPDGAWSVETPRLPIEATGCGDAVAALFLGWLLKGEPVPDALATTIAAIYGVIEATMRSPGGELALVAAQDELVSPSRRVTVQRL